MKGKKVFISALFFGFVFFQSQQSVFFQDKEKYRWALAENLYQTKVYNASQYEYARAYFYSKFLSESKKEAAQFFDNVIGVILRKNNAEEGLESFMRQYPHSAYVAQASLPLADYYLSHKLFDNALETLQSINQYQLSSSENTQYLVKLGYAQFMTGDTNSATEALEQAYEKLPENQRDEIAYMLGHLYYEQGKMEEVFKYFDTLKEDSNYEMLVRPYYVQLYFSQQQYEKAIEEGENFLNHKVSEIQSREVKKIIGESYFMLEDYQKAYQPLKDYLKSQKKPSENDLYAMGYVCSKLEKYSEAVSYYNQLVNSQSAFSQNAYYQLGNAYLLSGSKPEALSAFRSAYQMNYDEKVKKLAHEQYAKISYNIGNPFEPAAEVIQSYLNQYPDSEKNTEMKSLLIKSYLYSGNYKQTLDAIDKLSNYPAEVEKINQEVSFLLGIEEYNKENFVDSENYLLRSLSIGQDKNLSARAIYWIGQINYQKGEFRNAILNYHKIVDAEFPEKKQLFYDLGYAYFKSNDLENAKKYFEEYLKNPAPKYKSDAEIRLADTYYAFNQLDKAVAIYDKAQDAKDYTLFQKALSVGFQGDNEGKIKILRLMLAEFPHSNYADDAAYELAVAYVNANDILKAKDFFSKVEKNSTDKDLVARSQIHFAQLYSMQNQDDKALEELEKLAQNYKNTIYVDKILQTARSIFVKKNDVQGYKNFASRLNVTLEQQDIQDINLNTARNFYTKKDFKNAILYYENYLAQRPENQNLYQTEYELAESYFQIGDMNKATEYMQKIAEQTNDYQEEAQTRMAQIYLKSKHTQGAKKYLEQLKNSSQTRIKSFADLELMKIYADEKDFNNAEKLADEVLSNSKNSTAVLELAKVIKARALMSKGRDAKAYELYLSLEKSPNSEVAAEALYAKAFYLNKQKLYKQSNEVIFRLANNYASEEYWGAKSLVVMVRNYTGLKDKYQATYTADQILENYKDFPEVIAEAQQTKKEIK